MLEAPYALCPEVKRHEITPEEFLKAHKIARHGQEMVQVAVALRYPGDC